MWQVQHGPFTYILRQRTTLCFDFCDHVVRRLGKLSTESEFLMVIIVWTKEKFRDWCKVSKGRETCFHDAHSAWTL